MKLFSLFKSFTFFPLNLFSGFFDVLVKLFTLSILLHSLGSLLIKVSICFPIPYQFHVFSSTFLFSLDSNCSQVLPKYVPVFFLSAARLRRLVRDRLFQQSYHIIALKKEPKQCCSNWPRRQQALRAGSQSTTRTTRSGHNEKLHSPLMPAVRARSFTVSDSQSFPSLQGIRQGPAVEITSMAAC